MNTKDKLITAPAEEPITVAEVKSNLSIKDTLQDTEIARFISSARRQAEAFLNKKIITQTWEVAFDYFPDELELIRTPVQSVTSITYTDPDGSGQTVDSANYYLDNYGTKHWIIAANDYTWPSTYDSANAVKVRYVSGYGSAADVPDEIKQCIHLMVGYYVNHARQAEAGATNTRSLNWMMSDVIGHLRDVRM